MGLANYAREQGLTLDFATALPLAQGQDVARLLPTIPSLGPSREFRTGGHPLGQSLRPSGQLSIFQVRYPRIVRYA